MEKAGKKQFSFRMVPSNEEKCIWMEAGVIDFKLCNNYYNCHTCGFDKAMKQTADKNAAARALGVAVDSKKAGIVDWRERMKHRQGLERKCRHALTGRAPVRLCPYDYECSSCEFDQMLEDGLELQIPYRLKGIPEIEGYGVPDGHFFHMGHTWARVEAGGRIRIGMDDFSTRIFGKADKFELPLTGEELRTSEVGLAFSRKSNEANVLAPLSGVVAAVNYQAVKDPTLVKEEPYNDGWLMVIEPAELKKDLKELMHGNQTAEWIVAEHYRLLGLVSQVGLTLADGGSIDDVYGAMPDLEWKKLTTEFLRT